MSHQITLSDFTNNIDSIEEVLASSSSEGHNLQQRKKLIIRVKLYPSPTTKFVIKVLNKNNQVIRELSCSLLQTAISLYNNVNTEDNE